MKLDTFTKQLIIQLQSNCRQSITTIAKKLKADRSTIKKYIQELEKKKIIQSYSILLDYRALGYSLQVDFFIKVVPEHHDTVYKKLAQIPEISHLLFFSGSYDILAIALFHNIDELDRFFVNKIASIMGMISITSSIVLSHYHRKTSIETTDLKKNETLSEFDQKIVLLLRDHGNMSYIDLAKNLGTSKQIIYYHIQQLIKRKIIKKFTTIIDYKKLGYAFNTVLLLEIELSLFHSVLEQLKKLKEIFWINTLAPTRSILLNIIFLDRLALNDFLDKKIATIPGIKGINMNIVLRDFIRYYV